MRGLCRATGLVLVLVAAAAGSAAPPEAPSAVTAKPGRVREIVLKVPATQEIGYRLVGGPAAFRELKGDAPGERVFWLVVETDAPAFIVWWTVGEKGSAVTEINAAPVPPEPIPPPEPKPDPAPDPVGALRVIFVYETQKPLSRDESGAIFSPGVEKYLNERCSKDAKGRPEWNVFDPDQKFAAGFNPTLKALFTDSLAEARKAMPAVVVAVGKEARVYRVTNETDLLAVLKRHAEGK